MQESSAPVRSAKIPGWIGALCILAGSVLLWRDSQATYHVYAGSYDPAIEEVFSVGPSLLQVSGELLLSIGFGVLCLALGIILARKARQSRQRRLVTRLIWLSGLLVLAAGTGVLIWDSLQVQSFGWFAYAPLTNTTFSPGPLVTGTEIFGKLLSVAGLGAIGLGLGMKMGASNQHTDA